MRPATHAHTSNDMDHGGAFSQRGFTALKVKKVARLDLFEISMRTGSSSDHRCAIIVRLVTALDLKSKESII